MKPVSQIDHHPYFAAIVSLFYDRWRDRNEHDSVPSRNDCRYLAHPSQFGRNQEEILSSPCPGMATSGSSNHLRATSAYPPTGDIRWPMSVNLLTPQGTEADFGDRQLTRSGSLGRRKAKSGRQAVTAEFSGGLLGASTVNYLDRATRPLQWSCSPCALGALRFRHAAGVPSGSGYA